MCGDFYLFLWFKQAADYEKKQFFLCILITQLNNPLYNSLRGKGDP